MKSLGSDQGSSTHSDKRSRLAAIEAGWTRAKDLDPQPVQPAITKKDTPPSAPITKSEKAQDGAFRVWHSHVGWTSGGWGEGEILIAPNGIVSFKEIGGDFKPEDNFSVSCKEINDLKIKTVDHENIRTPQHIEIPGVHLKVKGKNYDLLTGSRSARYEAADRLLKTIIHACRM